MLLLVLAGCNDCSNTGSPSERAPSVDWTVTPTGGWHSIADLARPTIVVKSPGGTRHLKEAFLIARRGDTWDETRLERPQASIESFSGGASAFAALRRWEAQGGGLVDVGPNSGREAIDQTRLVGLAAHLATREDHAWLDVVYRLGHLQVLAGPNMFEATRGAFTLSEASRRYEDLGLPKPHPSADPTELVRILAAEASTSKSALRMLLTHEGRQDASTAVERVDPDTKKAAASFGIPLEVHDEAQIQAMEVFWLGALDGAKRNEPVTVTLARLREAANGSAPRLGRFTQSVISGAERIVQELEAAHGSHDDTARPTRLRP